MISIDYWKLQKPSVADVASGCANAWCVAFSNVPSLAAARAKPVHHLIRH